MSLQPRTLTLCASILALSTVLATAQSASDTSRLESADNTTTALLQQAQPAPVAGTSISPAGPHAQWHDHETKNFIGLSENAWDFSNPNGIHGFGPLPATEPSR